MSDKHLLETSLRSLVISMHKWCNANVNTFEGAMFGASVRAMADDFSERLAELEMERVTIPCGAPSDKPEHAAITRHLLTGIYTCEEKEVKP